MYKKMVVLVAAVAFAAMIFTPVIAAPSKAKGATCPMMTSGAKGAKTGMTCPMMGKSTKGKQMPMSCPGMGKSTKGKTMTCPVMGKSVKGKTMMAKGMKSKATICTTPCRTAKGLKCVCPVKKTTKSRPK